MYADVRDSKVVKIVQRSNSKNTEIHTETEVLDFCLDVIVKTNPNSVNWYFKIYIYVLLRSFLKNSYNVYIMKWVFNSKCAKMHLIPADITFGSSESNSVEE